MLYDQGYGEQDIIELHAFLDWMMKLPGDAEKQFQLELNAFEEAKQMKYSHSQSGKVRVKSGIKPRSVRFASLLLYSSSNA